ncbi:MAG: (Fe-S)-binding protein [Candidatus Thorarchaeota archaeon]
MSSIWTRTWKSTPRLDCGMCGYPTCAAFARAFIVEDTPIDSCPLFELPEFTNLKVELEAGGMRRSTLRDRAAPEPPEGGVLFTQPCKDTNEKVMAELRVFNGVPTGELVRFGVFDPHILCDLMDCLVTKFELVKCSRDLGYGRVDTGEMSITILQDGRVNMRRVDDREHVLDVFALIEGTIIGATICNCCGNDLLSVILGIAKGSESRHTVLNAGSSLRLDPEMKEELATGSEFKAAFGKDAMKSTRLIESIYEDLVDRIQRVAHTESQLELKSVESKDVLCSLVDLIGTPRFKKHANLILTGFGLVRVRDSAMIGLNEIENLLKHLEKDNRDVALANLKDASRGELSRTRPDHGNPRLFLTYAHILRVQRSVNLLKSWKNTL